MKKRKLSELQIRNKITYHEDKANDYYEQLEEIKRVKRLVGFKYTNRNL